jgi:hypothetical protein
VALALSVDNNKTYRLRDLRDSAVPRDKSELRAPSRRRKFEDRLSHPRAGQVVGEFPAKYEKTAERPQPRRRTLEVAAQRQQPRQAVAALMAREGISTATRHGARLEPADAMPEGLSEKPKNAWASLLEDAPKAPAHFEKSASDQAMEARLKRLKSQEKELHSLEKFAHDVDGRAAYSSHLRQMDARVLKEAGRLERSSTLAVGDAQQRNIELMQKEMAMNQQLNLQYLQLQEKLQRGLTSLLSNLLKVRSEATKSSISSA